MINLEQLIPRCHEAAKAKGFWDVTPHAGQQLMLTIGELGEAQEAHRKNKVTMLGCLQGMLNTIENVPEYFETRFAANVKDTVEDELADTYIRLLDYAGGFGVDVLSWERERQATRGLVGLDSVPENFGAALLPIVQDILNINTASKSVSEQALVSALLKLEMLAEREGIDLATHIDLKLRYNATRPAKHGKSY